jgi:phospholipase/carboxylesterase
VDTATIAGLSTHVEGAEHGPGTPWIVLLHGFAMRADELCPFARSLGVKARFLFPEGPVVLPPGTEGRAESTRAYWDVDGPRRAAALARGARDLSDEHPEGLTAAREGLGRFLTEAADSFGPGPLILGGFSQGAMLSLDYTLHAATAPAALLQLSGAPLGVDRWRPLFPRLRGLPVFASHGDADPDLSFAAAARLKDELAGAGAEVTWVPFEGRHEIPLVVWRALRKFLARWTKA